MFNNSIINNMPPVTKNLIIVNIIIWAAMALFPQEIGVMMDRHCGLHYFLSDNFIASQFITYQFVHADFTHLFFNMFALFMFGIAIEQIMGSKRFLSYYLICGIGAGLIQMGVNAIEYFHYAGMLSNVELHQVLNEGTSIFNQGKNYIDPTLGTINLLINMPTVGASGAVYGILLAFGMFLPNQPMYIMFIPYPVKAKWVVIGYAAIELILGMGHANTGIAHFAHLGGMIFGFLIILYWKKTGTIRKNDNYY